MPLIRVPQHTPEDLAAWERLEREDAAWAARPRLGELAAAALDLLADFRPDYVSCSWGKDSLVLAHLAWTLGELGGHRAPLVWVRVRDRENPWCPAVRDAYLAAHSCEYHEIEADAEDAVTADGRRALTSGAGFREAARRFGPRRATGLRGDESGGRRRRMEQGLVLGDSCAPLGHWTARDVYAYLYRERLPVHPAYAMSHGGRLDRDRLRVASLGGDRGRGMGRAEWERRYYR